MELLSRKSIRLQNYDYSQNGAYFITICTKDKHNVLCNCVGDGFPVPNSEIAQIVEFYIGKITCKYSNVFVDKYVIMPNHIHLLLFFYDKGTGDPSPTLGNVIGWFKYQTTKEINMKCSKIGEKFWQRSFYDHVIRAQQSYDEIWQYIDENPLKWQLDKYYIENKEMKP